MNTKINIIALLMCAAIAPAFGMDETGGEDKPTDNKPADSVAARLAEFRILIANNPPPPVNEDEIRARAEALERACKQENIKRDQWLTKQQKKRTPRATAQQKDGKKKQEKICVQS